MITSIVFAAGCFWGVEKHFEHMAGVLNAESGYAGGTYANPTYKTVLAHRYDKSKDVKNYAEAVKVTYDNSKIDAKTLIKSFWELHDPTQVNGQGNDIGNNYRSAIFYTNEHQKEVAYATAQKYQKLLNAHGYGKITTEIKPLKKFYVAEQYHQDYLQKNPNGYCPNHATNVKFIEKDTRPQTITPLGGKEILIIKSEYFCPYCEKFKHDVSASYKGNIPMRTVLASQLKGFDIQTKLYATPTILFIQNGKEVAHHTGFMNAKDFYKMLGAFKLEKSKHI
jgi:peptide methionine sulfoxide reductase msrA/msrB